MIPIRDTQRSQRIPFVNYLLIAACAGAFVLELRAGPEIDAFIDEHALYPGRFVALAARRGLLDPAVYGPLFKIGGAHV